MTATFGLAGVPDDAYDISSGGAFLDGYDRPVDLLGPEFTTLWANDHFQFGDAPTFDCWTFLCVLAARRSSRDERSAVNRPDVLALYDEGVTALNDAVPPVHRPSSGRDAPRRSRGS
jgi:hypothetical protein